MSLTPFQLELCRLVARRRMAAGESYLAGGATLNFLIGSPRISRDIDLFHDTAEAVAASWDADRKVLRAGGYDVDLLRERPAYVEAVVGRGEERVILQWARDSAYRFFPLVEHPDLGLVLHPFDLATNKVLALVGRLEPRDWVDLIACHDSIQPLGCLTWAACGKDPAFCPRSILEHAARTTRYTDEELRALAFESTPPSAADLARRWHGMLDEAGRVVSLLPAERAGCCVLDRDGRLFRSGPDQLAGALAHHEIAFHAGRIGGALPQIRGGRDS